MLLPAALSDRMIGKYTATNDAVTMVLVLLMFLCNSSSYMLNFSIQA